MSIKLTYFVHWTTPDNEQALASGHNDIHLSKLWIQQAKELWELRKDNFDIVITSDLTRAIDTAKLAFSDRCMHLQDERLRECDYGELTQKKKNWSNEKYVNSIYPNGESYMGVEMRIKELLEWLKKNYEGKHVAFVAHQAPQLALDVLIKNMSWKEAIKKDWRNTKDWQPGWEYLIK